MNSFKITPNLLKENKQVVAIGEERGGKISEKGEGNKEVQISSYEINVLPVWNVQCEEYSQ